MHPTFRYLSTATLLLAILAWLSMSLSGSVALAEVLKATEQHKLVRFQLREIADHKTPGVLEIQRTAYVDLVAPRLRLEGGRITADNLVENRSIMVMDYQHDRFLKLISHRLVVDEDRAADETQAKRIQTLKAFLNFPNKKAYLYRLKRDEGKPFDLEILIKDRPLLDSMRKFQAHTETLSTRVDLDGRAVLKYRLQEGNATTSLWVDPQTRLPLRIEVDKSRPAPDVTRARSVLTDFEWDPKVADLEQLFSTEPPPGYTVEDHPKAAAAPPTEVQDRAPRTEGLGPRAIREKLEDKVPMVFPNEIPLEGVLKYVRAATRGPNDTGLPFAFDEDGMRRAGRTRTSLVTLDVTDEPLKNSLAQLLKPLGLTYEDRNGILTITSDSPGGRKKP